MNKYKLYNKVFGWVAFFIAAIVYLLTIEPTASFWDCGEFIATAFRLEVGHPPGAPLFMIMSRFFTIFSIPENAAKMVNILSALASAFTIMFLFWTITHLAKKIIIKNNNYSINNIIAIIGSGFVGAMSYTFSDTFWFSAVEAEVYATSSLFTAIVFWAILKWENEAGEKYSNRWIILIAYLIGLSIGVHLLNLLAIPAIVFVYYFKTYKVTKKGIFNALLISVALLGSIMYIIIPGVFKLASWFELLFVNGFGLPYNSGVVFYVILLIAILVVSLRYTIKHNKVILNTLILGITVILIGYSSFSMVVIRSIADPPMDQNNPDNVFNLLSYINREQYGDRPLLYGQSFNAPVISREKGKAVYAKQDGKYKVVNHKAVIKYDSRFTSFFPRMYSSDSRHVKDYKAWVDINGKSVSLYGNNGKSEKLVVPSFGDNLTFFFKYQVGYMYLRYFMWNFAGRQNDIQGHGGILKGNWISGIPVIDNARLGTQDNLPQHMKNNHGRNKYYFLPLLLGLAGLLYQYKKSKNDFFVVMMLFILTGLAIVVYLNQYPHQPRERDYAYAGSFYAFAIWIGLGVLALFKLLSKKLAGGISSITAVIISLLAVPTVMASENWDDHDRSGCYSVKEIAYNYLNTCKKNAIIFTNGDNDTFPLWYAQEVEGIRTDVRVVNLSYLRADWYINQMARKAYESDPLPFSLQKRQYQEGSRDVVPLINRINKPVDIYKVMEFVRSDNDKTKMQSPFERGKRINYIPTKQIEIPIDKNQIIEKELVSEKYKDKIVGEMIWNPKQQYFLKDGLMLLDILANNDWNRPIYWAITVSSDKYFNLDKYFMVTGLAYQLVPIKTQNKSNSNEIGFVDTDIMYNNLMNKYLWGSVEDTNVYFNENNRRMYSNMRYNFGRLANALIKEGKEDKAEQVLDRCVELLPNSRIAFDYSILPIIRSYYASNNPDKAKEISKQLFDILADELLFYKDVIKKNNKEISLEIRQDLYIMQQLAILARNNGQTDYSEDIMHEFEMYLQLVQ